MLLIRPQLITSGLLLCLAVLNPLISRAQTSGSIESGFSNSTNSLTNDQAMPQDNLNPQAEEAFQPKPMPEFTPRVNDFDLGSEIFYYRYREPQAGVTISGPMYGFDGGYTYRPLPGNLLNNIIFNDYALQARYANTDALEYKGSGVVKGKHDEAMEFRGLMGRDYFIGYNSMVTPYFGFGYRELFDRGNGEISSTGQWGYDRRSHYYYLPVGGNAAIMAHNDWEVDLNAEYDVFLQGWQKSYLSDGDQFGGDEPNVSNHQDSGYGVRASIKLIKKYSLADVYVKPYLRYWSIEHSKVVDDGIEPKNNTTEIGSEFGIDF